MLPNFSYFKSILLSMCKKATKNNCNYEKRLVILLLYYAVARGGEPKFLRYDEMAWDYLLELIDGYWTQLKTLEKTPITFGPHFDYWLFDLFHSFACFYVVNDGLYRKPEEAKIAKYVFPSFYKVSNESVTRNITAWLRQHCSTELKKATSSKSIRKGAYTALAMNPLISKEERLVRGAWVPADMSDKEAYKDLNPALTYPGFCGLAGWPDPHAWPKPMRLCPQLGEEALRQIGLFQSHIFVNNIGTYVQSLPVMDMLIDTCTAAAIMYHPKMFQDVGMEDPMVDKMLSAVVEIGLAATKDVAQQIIGNWSQIILADFNDRNNHIRLASNRNLSQIIDMQTTTIQRVDRSVMDLHTDLQQMALKLDRLEKAVPRTPPHRSSPSPPRKRSRQNNSPDDEEEEPPASAAASVAPLFLSFGSVGAFVASGSNSKILLSQVIEHLYSSGQLKNQEKGLTSTSYPGIIRENRAQYQAVMRLLEQSLSDENKTDLAQNGLSTEEIKNLAEAIELQAREHMAFLEGREMGRAKAYITGLGARYIKYEKKHKNRRAVSQPGIGSFLSRTANAAIQMLSPSKQR
jgi:hypothetical protein